MRERGVDWDVTGAHLGFVVRRISADVHDPFRRNVGCGASTVNPDS
jgi:hypothetical protein